MTEPQLPIGKVPVVPQDEKGFQKWVVDHAKRLGWTVNHTYAAKLHDGSWRTTTTLRGMPDLTCVLPAVVDSAGDELLPGAVVFFEVKGADARRDRYPQQMQVIALLQRVGGNVEAWFVQPKDHEDVMEILKQGRP